MDKIINTPEQVIAELRGMSDQFICPQDTYFGSMADVVERLVTERDEAKRAARFCWTCGCKSMWSVYRRDALEHWPWLEGEEDDEATNPL